MKKLILLLSLVSLAGWAQELTETEKEMVEVGRKTMGEKPGTQASPGLQARMQAEAGVFTDEVDCKFDLVGTDMLTETTVEKEALDMDACKKKAMTALKASHKNFRKVVIKHKSSPKEIVIPRKK